MLTRTGEGRFIADADEMRRWRAQSTCEHGWPIMERDTCGPCSFKGPK
jgi:hypothetical protein